jgi:hypothetical protein
MTTKTKITIRSTFHPPHPVRVIPAADGTLSERQVQRIEKALCGMSDCRCGGLMRSRIDEGGEITLLREGEGALYMSAEEPQ